MRAAFYASFLPFHPKNSKMFRILVELRFSTYRWTNTQRLSKEPPPSVLTLINQLQPLYNFIQVQIQLYAGFYSINTQVQLELEEEKKLCTKLSSLHAFAGYYRSDWSAEHWTFFRDMLKKIWWSFLRSNSCYLLEPRASCGSGHNSRPSQHLELSPNRRGSASGTWMASIWTQ